MPPKIAAVCEAALAKDPAARPASAGALAARVRAAAQAAQASTAALLLRTVAVDRTVAADRPAEPARRLWADQTQAAGHRCKSRRRFRMLGGVAAVVALLGAAVAAVVFWHANVDRPEAVAPSATVRQAPATRPASITVMLRYWERVWTPVQSGRAGGLRRDRHPPANGAAGRPGASTWCSATPPGWSWW